MTTVSMCRHPSQLNVVFQEFAAAVKLLHPLAHQPVPKVSPSDVGEKITSPHILAAIGRIYLQAGDLAKATLYFTEVSTYYAAVRDEDGGSKDESFAGLVRMNDALLACAEGRWEDAERGFVELIKRDGEAYAVSYLQSGSCSSKADDY